MRLQSASLLLLLIAAACAPTANELRMQRVHQAKAEAGDRPGHRQARDLAEAIHAAYQAGDYAHDAAALERDVASAVTVIDRATTQPTLDTPTLVGWKGLLLIDAKRYEDGFATLHESFEMRPNLLAGQNLIVIYGAANRTEEVSATCSETLAVVEDADDRMELIGLCRRHMNAASTEGELAWMRPDQASWYQAERARREEQELTAQAERDEQARFERSVVRQVEQCSLTCKQTGLRCQNRCDGDASCDSRCVEINHACVDRCGSVAYEQLDVEPAADATR